MPPLFGFSAPLPPKCVRVISMVKLGAPPKGLCSVEDLALFARCPSCHGQLPE